MRYLLDEGLNPYELRDALVAAAAALRNEAAEWDAADAKSAVKSAETIERLVHRIRPRAEGVGTWHEKVGVGVVRVHHAMKVSHQCDPWGFDLWERVVWPDEAHDALELHMREAHAEEKAHVDIVLASPRVRRSHITAMRSDDG